MNLQLQLQQQQPFLALNTTLNANAVTAIWGPSGAGKSTLLKTIAGLAPRHANNIVKHGNSYWQQDKLWTPAYQRGAAYVFQQAHLPPHLNAAEILNLSGHSSACEQVELAQIFGLNQHLNHHPHMLSGGEKQRLAIAAAVASKPQWLLLDEPLTGLDDDAKATLLTQLKSLLAKQRIPTLYVSHDLNEIAQLADQVMCLENGQITAQAPLESALVDFNLPFALHRQAGAAVRATVDSPANRADANDGLCYLHSSIGKLRLPYQANIGSEEIKLFISARDVSVAKQPAAGSSVLNILAAKVSAVSAAKQGYVTVRLTLGNGHLLARLSAYSAQTLSLQTGSPVFAHIKAAAVHNGL